MEKKLSKRIKQLRELKGLTQSQLAEILGIKNQTVSNYESGEREPSYDILLKLADCFGVTTDYLFGRTNIERNMLPELSEDLKKIWDACLDNEQFLLVFKEILNIMESLINLDLKYNSNYLSESKGLFSGISDFYKQINSSRFSRAYIKEQIDKADAHINYVNARFNEIKWIPFEPPFPWETEQKDGE